MSGHEKKNNYWNKDGNVDFCIFALLSWYDLHNIIHAKIIQSWPVELTNMASLMGVKAKLTIVFAQYLNTLYHYESHRTNAQRTTSPPICRKHCRTLDTFTPAICSTSTQNMFLSVRWCMSCSFPSVCVTPLNTSREARVALICMAATDCMVLSGHRQITIHELTGDPMLSTTMQEIHKT